MSAHRGGLLELVARGKKDVFFTANPQASFFHSVYARYAPFTEEVYVCQPKNAPEWGRWMEFDVEHRGDLMRKIYLRIRLPTWLPDSLAAVNGTSLITDAAGVSYGYCNNIGYQVIEKIQLFQDQVLVQELYGEYLDWRLRQTNTLAQTLVIATTAGTRGETVIDVGRAATPGLLRVPIPLVGWEAIGEPGFPMAAMRQQRFRLRVLLRRLEDVVVASDDRSQPQPWGKPLRVQYAKGGPVDTSQVARPREALNKDIEVSLETSQVYVPTINWLPRLSLTPSPFLSRWTLRDRPRAFCLPSNPWVLGWREIVRNSSAMPCRPCVSTLPTLIASNLSHHRCFARSPRTGKTSGPRRIWCSRIVHRTSIRLCLVEWMPRNPTVRSTSHVPWRRFCMPCFPARFRLILVRSRGMHF